MTMKGKFLAYLKHSSDRRDSDDNPSKLRGCYKPVYNCYGLDIIVLVTVSCPNIFVN